MLHTEGAFCKAGISEMQAYRQMSVWFTGLYVLACDKRTNFEALMIFGMSCSELAGSWLPLCGGHQLETSRSIDISFDPLSRVWELPY